MQSDNPGLILAPPLYPAMAWIAALALEWLAPLTFLPPFGVTSWSLWLGALLAIIGAIIVFRAIGQFRAAGTAVEPGRPVTDIVTTGLYRFSRNPMYLGCLAFHTGLCLMAGLEWGVLSMPLVFLAFDRLAVLPEEAYLTQKFGGAYTRYRVTTRRWF